MEKCSVSELQLYHEYSRCVWDQLKNILEMSFYNIYFIIFDIRTMQIMIIISPIFFKNYSS